MLIAREYISLLRSCVSFNHLALNVGVNTTLRGGTGETALDKAQNNGHTDIVDLLTADNAAYLAPSV